MDKELYELAAQMYDFISKMPCGLELFRARLGLTKEEFEELIEKL